MDVLFVCSGNIGRSQMAMEYFKKFSRDRTASAGTRVTVPGESIGDREDAQPVLQSMNEDGIDMSDNVRIPITEELMNEYDKVIVMAEPDRTPNWLSDSPKFEYWDITNVNGLPVDEVSIIRDGIKARVQSLAQQ
jgi:protein-tyrosine-phosphatase